MVHINNMSVKKLLSVPNELEHKPHAWLVTCVDGFVCSNTKDQVYNVVLNDQTSLNQLFSIRKKLILRKTDLAIPGPFYRDFRAGDVRHSRANIGKAEKLLGFDPQYKIDEGLSLSMDWYVDDLL